MARPAAVPPTLPQVPPVVAAPIVPPTLAAPPKAAPVGTPATTWVPKGPAFNWEQFMGVRLFAWVGGLALFLGVAFFVRYSFEHNWISPEVRVAVGFLTGLGLAIGGTLLHQRRYRVPAQSLCATGVVILYATTFACRSVYHFDFFGLIPTFLLMALITAAAFLLAVRLDALVVAILGLFGGFLTPILLSTGQDNPLGLFGYIALLDAGLIALSWRRRWHFLVLLGALGTVVMQLGWLAEFFERERYFEGAKILVVFAVFVGFSWPHLAAFAAGERRGQGNPWFSAAAILLLGVALLVPFYLMEFAPLGQQPARLFGYVLLVDLGLLAVAWLADRLVLVQVPAGAVVFALLTYWTFRYLKADLLYWGLGLVFLFGILHALVPWVRQQLRPETSPAWWGQLFPLAALLLLMIPIFRMEPVPFAVWPFVLLLDLAVVTLAVLSASVVWIVAALGLTALVTACWVIQLPAALDQLPAELSVIGGFALFFFAVGVLAALKLRVAGSSATAPATGASGRAAPRWDAVPPDWLPRIPMLSAVLPFLLLILVTYRLPLADPSPVFGVALLLVILLLGLAHAFALKELPLLALSCVLALEHQWHFRHFDPGQPTVPLLWYLGFTLGFALFPFLFWRRFAGQVLPWTAAALSGPLHFYLVHRLVKLTWPNEFMGLLPVLFALPSTAGLVFLIRRLRADAPRRPALLAWFGGAALFFVTLIFPIQFDRQWITIGWALEGAALLWLYHRVPHEGLRWTGFGLLFVAFVRLALNPAVLDYHPRAQTAIFNWYLYAYGLVIASLFAGAALLAPPRHRLLGSDGRAILNVLGTILAFLLLNIELADYFTEVGAASLTFRFTGNFARDMTYSIAWAAFALVLLVIGLWRRRGGARYAGLALLTVTLLKLFFHDLSQLAQLYRIGALVGVAIVAILASFLYQRYFASTSKSNEPGSSSPPAGN